MYILFTYDATNFTFQLKDEAGVNIGSANVYARANYKIPELPIKGSQFLTVYPIDTADGTFPFTAQYPRDRIVSY